MRSETEAKLRAQVKRKNIILTDEEFQRLAAQAMDEARGDENIVDFYFGGVIVAYARSHPGKWGPYRTQPNLPAWAMTGRGEVMDNFYFSVSDLAVSISWIDEVLGEDRTRWPDQMTCQAKLRQAHAAARAGLPPVRRVDELPPFRPVKTRSTSHE